MEHIFTSLQFLISRFQNDEIGLVASSSSYQETEARVEYIDPFFSLLGWDLHNSRGLPYNLRDVLREESQVTETSSKKPDYTFRIHSIRKFFVEAKKPSVDIRTSKESAFQVRSYGYTAGLPISVLTNFRTTRIYNTTIEPKSADDVNVGLIISYDHSDYLSQFDTIFRILGRENVANNSIIEFVDSSSRGLIPANTSFLNRINNWRSLIANDILLRHPNLDIEEISDVTQKIINRIIFIRMCEDRGIEGEELLRNIANSQDSIQLRTLFKKMDDRYNTGLFDMSSELEGNYCDIDSDLFLSIVSEIYTPHSPYSFSVLDADFLGQVYELFLGYLITKNSDNVIVLTQKPTFSHREIIVTPQPIVEELVRRTFKEKIRLLKENNSFTLSSLLSLRILDIAVGSGRFLIRALDELISLSIEILINEKDSRYLYQINSDVYRLDFNIKKQLLVNCLYGLDIDYNAIEIAQFSLMVRLLEDETNETLPKGHKILPDLSSNIIFGNSVVESDYSNIDQSNYQRTNPLSWEDSGLPDKFDVIIGNPPYIKTEDMINDNLEEFNYLKLHFQSSYKQFDKYFSFIEKSLSKMAPDSWLGFIIPNKWITIESGKKIREILSANRVVYNIVNFGNEHLFDGRSAYSCLLILTKSGSDEFFYRQINSTNQFLLDPMNKGYPLPQSIISNFRGKSWILPNNEMESDVLRLLLNNSILLSDLADVKNGIQTSLNSFYLIQDYFEEGNIICFSKNNSNWKIEKNITRPFISNSENILSYKPIIPDSLVIFPYYLSSSGTPTVFPPDELKSNFPLSWDYFLAHYGELIERNVSPPQPQGVFYAYGRGQALDAVFSSPKIIYSVNQKGDKYGIDFNGIAYASGGTAGEVAIFNPKNGYSLEFFLGLLNQKPIEFFARKRGSPFGRGWYARGSAVVKDLPIPNLDIQKNEEHKKIHNRVVSLVIELISLKSRQYSAIGRNQMFFNKRINWINSSLELIFNSIWGFSDQIESLILPGEME